MSTQSKKVEDDVMDIINIFDHKASSQELKAGIHENVRLVSAFTERKRDRVTNALIKKQVFLKFKKFDTEGNDIGEKDISFFLVDPNRDSVISDLRNFLVQLKEILTIYYTDEEMAESFDPIKALVGDEDVNADDFLFDNIKKNVFKNKSKNYAIIEAEAAKLFGEMLEPKIGMESDQFRLKLVDSRNKEFIQLPHYERFIESTDVDKEDSKLNNK